MSRRQPTDRDRRPVDRGEADSVSPGQANPWGSEVATTGTPGGPRGFGAIPWATDWRPGTLVELIRPGPKPVALLLLAGIPAGLVALVCLFQLGKWTGAEPGLVYPATVVYSLLVGALAAIWVTGVNPRRRIRCDWETSQLEVRTVAGTKRWPFAEIRRLAKYQSNGHVQLYARLSDEPVILFDSDDHGRLGFEMKHKQLTPLAMELTTALGKPPSQGPVVAEKFSWGEILRHASRVALALFAGLLAWSLLEAFWLKSNWLIGLPAWGLAFFLQVGLPTLLGVGLGQKWVAAGQWSKAVIVGGLGLLAGVGLLVAAVTLSRGQAPGTASNWLALALFCGAMAAGLFGVGVLLREHLRPYARRDRLYPGSNDDD